MVAELAKSFGHAENTESLATSATFATTISRLKRRLVAGFEFSTRVFDRFEDDDLPDFFYDEPLPPSDKAARFRADEVRKSVARWWQEAS